uniref:Putative Cullin 1 n=1 Tax=Davidia involucrata TaxID=16924 RepID=A0A5B6YRY3_DAVIN
MASEAHEKTISFEEGWPVLQEGINKLIDIIEGVHNNQFTSEEYMNLYTTTYRICQPNPLGPESQKLYDKYKKTFEDYITSEVLPSLREKKDESLLEELVKRWNNHKVMTRWLARFFHYLDRYFVSRKGVPTMHGASFLTFYKLVYGEMNHQVRDAVISMIDLERKGEQINQALVKNILDIYVEMGEGSMKYYEKDFEEPMLKDTTAFYSRNASVWITSKSYKDYMLKVDGCLNQEQDRVSCYLQQISQKKLFEVVEHELLSVHASKLEEKKRLDGEAA